MRPTILTLKEVFLALICLTISICEPYVDSHHFLTGQSTKHQYSNCSVADIEDGSYVLMNKNLIPEKCKQGCIYTRIGDQGKSYLILDQQETKEDEPFVKVLLAFEKFHTQYTATPITSSTVEASTTDCCSTGWTEWSEWSSCTKQRSRTCPGNNCGCGETSETKDCSSEAVHHASCHVSFQIHHLLQQHHQRVPLPPPLIQPLLGAGCCGRHRGERERPLVVKLATGVFLLGTTPDSQTTTNPGHLLTSEFLSHSDFTWQQGPALPLAAVGGCAVALSGHQFLVFGFYGIREFDTKVAGPFSEDGWLPASKWPRLPTERSNPSCSVIGHIIVVAGV